MFTIMKIWAILTIILLLNLETSSAQFKTLQELDQQKIIDSPQTFRLAQQQKFQIPMNGRYISYQIQYFPQNNGECSFKQPEIQYKIKGQSSNIFGQDEKVVATIVLKKQQKVFLADPYFNIVAYSIDQHKLLKRLMPKTSLLNANQRGSKNIINSLAMVTTQQEDYIYYLSGGLSFSFSTKNLASQIQSFSLNLTDITKAIYHKGFIIIISKQQGVHIFKVNKSSHNLTKVQTINKSTFSDPKSNLIDMEIDSQRELLYILTETSVQIFLFQPSDFPQNDQFKIILPYDFVDLTLYTKNHGSKSIQNNQNIDIQISKEGKPEFFILFSHIRRNLIAQFVYNSASKQVIFLRYFKFQMQIFQMSLVKDYIMVLGNDILGIFPYGVDPRLIKQQFNGYMTLSNLQHIILTQPPFFVGIAKDKIQYGGVFFEQQSGLICHLGQNSLIKKITFSGNTSSCNSQFQSSYNKYCSYSKTFLIEAMDIVTTSTISSSIWISMIVFVVLTIFGILIMLILHKRKEEQIKKLQLYFDQKRRNQIPASSDRRGNM